MVAAEEGGLEGWREEAVKAKEGAAVDPSSSLADDSS